MKNFKAITNQLGMSTTMPAGTGGAPSWMMDLAQGGHHHHHEHNADGSCCDHDHSHDHHTHDDTQNEATTTCQNTTHDGCC